MASPQMSKPTRGAMAGSYSNPNRNGRTVSFHTSNTFEALATAAGSDGSSSTGSPTSSGGSASLLGRNEPRGAPVTQSQGHFDVQKLQAAQQLATPKTPQQVRRMNLRGNCTSPSFNSPPFNPSSHVYLQAAQQYRDGSPHKMTPNRLAQLQGSGNNLGAQVPQRRGSHASQTSDNWRSARSSSFGSTLRSPTTVSSADDPITTSLSGVPEACAVQELGFRQGQHDRGSSRKRIPTSPFAKRYDHIWADSYKLGTVYGGIPAARPAAATSASSHENFAWTVLINPYTQDLEHPNGTVDMEWARNICIMSLNCMNELIRVVCTRSNDWRKIVCDIPAAAQDAIVAFPDLLARYETLKDAARQALGGGLPMGY
ncbi:hypothetical protein EJ02DRAFT_421045 [Clathrospora elynae]|uniref:Uncharacterized protein n=1 Tax=Clathrospora elynae TaxID=706981 RepID=A0A6A5SV71_9PLEO|nr:hypothetical protein EJ02DRAFT_421045 [Clathrospora elynae]